MTEETRPAWLQFPYAAFCLNGILKMFDSDIGLGSSSEFFETTAFPKSVPFPSSSEEMYAVGPQVVPLKPRIIVLFLINVHAWKRRNELKHKLMQVLFDSN